jgi:hypothetical protein
MRLAKHRADAFCARFSLRAPALLAPMSGGKRAFTFYCDRKRRRIGSLRTRLKRWTSLPWPCRETNGASDRISTVASFPSYANAHSDAYADDHVTQERS